MGIQQLHQLPFEQVEDLYRSVIPPAAFEHVGSLEPARFGPKGERSTAFRLTLPQRGDEVHLRVPAERWQGDYCICLDLMDLGAGQMDLSFIIINNLAAPRVDIDIDEQGHPTLLGTASRNLPEEELAVMAGLGPCQVRRGLRLFADLLPRLETMARRCGYVAIQLEPLTYHNAIMYERYGFGYIEGRRRMEHIDAAFQPGGVLHTAMDGSTRFRDPEMADSPRGRSWAIHDGILTLLDGEPHLELQMVKVIGQDAGVCTFHPPSESDL